jgi:hypothetical protein
MKEKPGPCLMGVHVQVVNAPGIEGAGPAHQAMHFITLVQEELGQIAAVLSGYPSNQGLFTPTHDESLSCLILIFLTTSWVHKQIAPGMVQIKDQSALISDSIKNRRTIPLSIGSSGFFSLLSRDYAATLATAVKSGFEELSQRV